MGLACWGKGAMDVVLRSGISKLVAMNKRGRAFGVFNAIFGAMWLVGSSAMGLLYGHSIPTLVALGVGAQFAAAGVFFSLRKQFR